MCGQISCKMLLAAFRRICRFEEDDGDGLQNKLAHGKMQIVRAGLDIGQRPENRLGKVRLRLSALQR